MTLHRITLAATSLAALASLPLHAGTVVASAPYGALVADTPVGTAGAAFPLIASDIFSGRISANTATTVAFETGSPVALLNAAGRYYLEIANGPLEGERFEINVAVTLSSGVLTLDLAAASNSTSNTLPAGALAAARGVVRPHITLAKIAGLFSPALVGSNDNAVADGVKIYGGPLGLTTYYLRPDGSWRTSPTAADQRNLVVAPDTSVIMAVRSGAKQMTQLGVVRTNVFRKKLKTGVQSFATGFPLDLSPTQLGAFVDIQESPAVRWTGSDTQSLADTLRVYDPAIQNYKISYLRADGTTWFDSGGAVNVASSPFLKSNAMLLISRIKADPGYLIVRPFSL